MPQVIRPVKPSSKLQTVDSILWPNSERPQLLSKRKKYSTTTTTSTFHCLSLRQPPPPLPLHPPTFPLWHLHHFRSPCGICLSLTAPGAPSYCIVVCSRAELSYIDSAGIIPLRNPELLSLMVARLSRCAYISRWKDSVQIKGVDVTGVNTRQSPPLGIKGKDILWIPWLGKSFMKLWGCIHM